MELSQDQIQRNIQKLRNKVGDARTGGKGSQRRKVKVVSKQTASNDKIVKNVVKKMGAHPLGVDEINFFKDDNTIMHFVRPEAYASIQNNTFIVSCEPQTKTIKDLIPDIIQQLGPKQHKLLKEIVSSGGVGDITAKNQETEESIPNLVSQNVPDLVETKPESVAETKPESIAETKPESVAETKPVTQTKPEPVAQTKPSNLDTVE